MAIRAFRSGDESVQARIYNEATAELPRFVPAQNADIARRVQARDFDPQTRLFACENDIPVGYVAFQLNGRVGYPWCLNGHEQPREELFAAALEALRGRGIRRAFAAYRADWEDIGRFFAKHGFRQTREMVNFVVELGDLHLKESNAPASMTPLREQDLEGVLALVPGLLRVHTVGELRQHYFQNPYFGPESVFVRRCPEDARQPAGLGIVIEKPPHADPRKVDSDMPCFRLGAFGTEGMTTKRINGMFSLLAPDGPHFAGIAKDMLIHAMHLLRQAGVPTIAAQAPSDVPHLLSFYEQHFRRQGSFPVYERDV